MTYKSYLYLTVKFVRYPSFVLSQREMTEQDIYSKLLKTFQNSTKMSIILLLSENEKMTVTQMAKQVDVTKANLYHFVGEMVRDGLLSKPEVKIRRNYVEKYYSLNEAAFKLADPVVAEEKLREAKPEQYRSLLQSFLTSLGLYFRLFAEEIARADSSKLELISSAFKKQEILLHYSVIGDPAYEYEINEYKKVIKRSIEKWSKKPSTKPRNRLIIVGLPRFDAS
jgi:DNA-binding HxlR family transcriptional regulator